jgi:hypothetical protein
LCCGAQIDSNEVKKLTEVYSRCKIGKERVRTVSWKDLAIP